MTDPRPPHAALAPAPDAARDPGPAPDPASGPAPGPASGPGPAPGSDEDAPGHRARVAALRERLRRANLDGFVVPRADEHLGEWLPPGAERLMWLTGFTGSAGVAIVLAETAAVFVDGRYTLQAADQVDRGLFTLCHATDHPATEWVAAALPVGGRLGYDPWLHPVTWVERMRKALDRVQGTLEPVTDNPVDAVWTDRPPAPRRPAEVFDPVLAGRDAADKQAELGEAIRHAEADACILSTPESINWLLNLRGSDIANTPIVRCFAIAHADGSVDLFIDPQKVGPEVAAHLGTGVRRAAPAELGPAVDRLGRDGRTVLLDAAATPVWFFDRLHRAGARVKRAQDPVALPKARKTAAELQGMRAAQHRDGVAVTRFLCWLDQAVLDADGRPRGVTEMAAAERLLGLRAESTAFRGPSFDTISGAGPNGAIVHYRVSERTNRVLEPGTLYLVDSGAQYGDGTTDITRTVAIGPPAPAMRRHFTLVLKGHIALARVRFPKGTTGSQLDVLARQFLWRHGLDYDHGTGHGVGHVLGVHEGPQRISKLPSSVPLEPGMILSNEPGVYRTGAYGIRIEALVAVCEAPAPDRDEAGAAAEAGAGAGDRPFYAFETLSLAPIDRRLIEVSLLDATEIAWLNAYHARVRAELGSRLVTEDERRWLDAATAPL